MKLSDLIGMELTECHFGKTWTRLVFSVVHDSERLYWLDTDNLVSDQGVQRYDPDRPNIATHISVHVMPCLEQRLNEIESVVNGLRFGFDSGVSLFITYDGETIDTLLKLTDTRTGEWLVA